MGKAKPGFYFSDSQEPVDHPQGEDIVIVIVILKVEIFVIVLKIIASIIGLI